MLEVPLVEAFSFGGVSAFLSLSDGLLGYVPGGSAEPAAPLPLSEFAGAMLSPNAVQTGLVSRTDKPTIINILWETLVFMTQSP
ncbi:MAG: hypothetical protein WBB95_06640 [Pseudomonas sp.]|uniref:hypothetical protein n=1 Tax=Pseudomonas sp. TaxID=306 RepID=UPI003C758BC3